MLIAPDKTGFPLIVVPEVELEVHLLPVSKLQIAQFIGETSHFNNDWYRTLLSLNPTISHLELTPKNRERFFVSGLLPNEAKQFARWLGEGFDLPTFKEWRAIYATLRREFFPDSPVFFEWASEPVGCIVRQILDEFPRQNMRDITLMRGGLVEWVQQDEGWLGLGAPRPHFHPNLWDPAKNHVKPLQLEHRLPYFGFRLVRRGQWATNKPDGVYIF